MNVRINKRKDEEMHATKKNLKCRKYLERKKSLSFFFLSHNSHVEDLFFSI